MQKKFRQYRLLMELSSKYTHVAYLSSMIEDSEHQVVLVVFSSSLFSFPYERGNLLRKAQHIKNLQNKYFVPILDMGIEEYQPFVVYEYLPNGSLRSRLQNISPRRLELQEALTIVLQVGEALTYAHEHNILHGNLKPENILFDSNGRAVLTDFYLVSSKDAIIRNQAKEEYAFCYMAPEQLVGVYDAKGDQYALGCLAYELITGRVPFAKQSLEALMRRPREAKPAPLSESVADLPPSLDAAVFRALTKDPDERFFDCSLFLDIIRSVLRMAEETKAVSLPNSQEPVLSSSFAFFAGPLGLTEPEDMVCSKMDSVVPPLPTSQARKISSILKIAEDAGIGGNSPQQGTGTFWISKSLVGQEASKSLILKANENAVRVENSSSAKQTNETSYVPHPLLEKKENGLIVEKSVESMHQINKDETSEIISLFETNGDSMEYAWEMSEHSLRKDSPFEVKGSSVNSPLTRPARHGRRKGRALLLVMSLVISLGIIAVWDAHINFLPNQDNRTNQSNTSVHPIPVVTRAIVSLIGQLPTPTPTVTFAPTPVATPTPIPISRPTPTPTPIPFLSLSLTAYMNNGGFGSAPGQANFDGSGYAYPAGQLPLAGQRTFNGVPYLFPGTGANDNVVALGQTINFTQGSYQQAFLLVAASWGQASGTVTIHYTDGSTSSASLSAPDWDTGGTSGSVVQTAYRYSPTGNDQAPVHIYAVQITINSGKIASSLTLPSIAKPAPNQPSLHVFALTLHHA
jgi:serine/threonine protein kinase